MTAKEYLSEVQRLQTIIEQKQDRIKEYRQIAASPHSAQLSPVKVQTSVQVDRIGDIVSKIADLEAEVQNDLFNLLDFQNKIINQIQGLKNPNHIKLLYKKYVEGKDFQTIAGEMNFTYQYTFEIQNKALRAFEAAYKDVLQKEGIPA